jgi:hypothetical protein
MRNYAPMRSHLSPEIPGDPCSSIDLDPMCDHKNAIFSEEAIAFSKKQDHKTNVIPVENGVPGRKGS